MASNLFYVHVIRTWMTNVGHFLRLQTIPVLFIATVIGLTSLLLRVSLDLLGFYRILSSFINSYYYVTMGWSILSEVLYRAIKTAASFVSSKRVIRDQRKIGRFCNTLVAH